MPDDLLLNLLSEAIGILFTVLILDRLIKWREEKRWEPVKKSTYHTITQITVDMYRDLLPYDNRTKPGVVFDFGVGNVTSLIGIDFESENLHENVMEDYRADPNYFYEKLDLYEDSYEDIIESRLFLLDEKLAGSLLGLPYLMHRVKRSIKRPIPDSLADDDEAHDLKTDWLGIETLILMAFAILQLMKQEATEIRTIEEERERMKYPIEDYRGVYDLWQSARSPSFKVWLKILTEPVTEFYQNSRDKLVRAANRIWDFVRRKLPIE